MVRVEESERGGTLVSQNLRDKIVDGLIKGNFGNLGRHESDDLNGRFRKGWFKDIDLEKRIQPESFDVSLADEAFILDSEQTSVLTPGQDKTVYRAVLELPKSQRQKIDISEGFEIKRGFSYLVPIQERFTLLPGERIKNSPKSSTGRLFPITRLIADYNPCTDEIDSRYCAGKLTQSWLLIQPGAFNLVIRPGDTLDQIRFIRGQDSSLSQREILEEHKRNPLLFRRDDDGDLIPIEDISVTDDGLGLEFDLVGRNTNGIIALRAKNNPEPIDVSRIGNYRPEDFFEPVPASKDNKGVKFFSGERYLLASADVLRIPSHLSAELRRHYGKGIRGTFDEAGFVDSGFQGDLVGEVVFQESGGISIRHGRFPFSALELFRTVEEPDKVYGGSIGSNYQGQLGPKTSKHFKQFDYAKAAKEYGKLDREVLVHDANVLRSFGSGRKGIASFDLIDPVKAKKLVDEINTNGFFHSRYDCEEDGLILQPIPYLLIFNEEGQVFTYVRAKNIQDYGDERLFGKFSIGIGGHINREDFSPEGLVRKALDRERCEEVRANYITEPKLIGTLFAEDKPVDRVHFGLVYGVMVDGEVRGNESSITGLGMFSPKEFGSRKLSYDKFETWSRVLIPELELIYDITERNK